MKYSQVFLKRAPCAALRPFVEQLWATSGNQSSARSVRRERVLPTGKAHIVFRLDNSQIRLFTSAADTKGYTVGSAAISGARVQPYYKETAAHAPSVGMVLRPGALAFLTGCAANNFSDTHTHLDAIWSPFALKQITERLNQTISISARLDLIETALLQRLPRVRGIHPAIAHALERFQSDTNIADIVAETNISHRHFIRIFETTVGLTPKSYQRVQRLNQALNAIQKQPQSTWVEIAHTTGFSDQAHLNREFAALAGVTPTQYRQLSQQSSHHLPV